MHGRRWLGLGGGESGVAIGITCATLCPSNPTIHAIEWMMTTHLMLRVFQILAARLL